ncbi:zinc ribbon domain-containing protein [Halosolutus halophilus]|uniref:zinc ribbon domain-containing protein n=1 Tax=Halosolutus halophilus TaxID=1552990 RepID=UPI0022352EAB|nr:zinc ribbon domain-containing protein [Halosolutus halophilus]
MSDNPGIAAVGTYIPSIRLTAEAVDEAWNRFDGPGIQQTAVPDADEDTLTMAAAAARRALDASAVDAGDVASVTLATTTPPLEETDLSVRLAEFLALPDDVSHAMRTQSTNAGIDALAEAHTDDGPALVVASDAPRGDPSSAIDHAAGTGAAAFVLTDGGAAAIRESSTYATDYPGTRFREPGSRTVDSLDIGTYERSAYTDVIAGAVDGLDADPASFSAIALQAPDGRSPGRAAGAIGADTDAVQNYAVVHDIGDVGAASVPLSLAAALVDDADAVLAVGHGSGATATALIVDREDTIPGSPDSLDLTGKRTVSYSEYLRLRGEVTPGEPAGGGAYVSVPSWKRSIPQRYRLEAGRCPSCEALNFLPDGACRRCHELVEYDSVQLDRRGTVEAVSVISQGGAPPEFAELQARSGDYATAIVAFDGPDGDTASAPLLVTDTEPTTVEVGDRVEATIRQIYTQEGVTRYGVKVRPID